jgi:hypothetical protein
MDTESDVSLPEDYEEEEAVESDKSGEGDSSAVDEEEEEEGEESDRGYAPWDDVDNAVDSEEERELDGIDVIDPATETEFATNKELHAIIKKTDKLLEKEHRQALKESVDLDNAGKKKKRLKKGTEVLQARPMTVINEGDEV